MVTLQLIKDGFKNIIKGLGTNKDARNYNTFTKGRVIDYNLASELYTYNWLAAKVVDIPVEDALRKWRSLLIPDADVKKVIEDKVKALKVKSKLELAFKWSRVYGGAVILAIINGDNPEEPLVIDNIKEGTLNNFIVLDRYNIYPEEVNRNILSDNFGNPEYYTVVRKGQRIHHTRLTKIVGETSTLQEFENNNYWGNSILIRLWEPISDSQTVSQAISNLIIESNVDVYSINGLMALVAEGKDELVKKRLEIAHQMKSVINGIVLDKEDQYDKKTNVFSELANLDDRYIQKGAGAADIPVTRLLGISPAGQNATGESDMLNYYDNVQSLQENEISPHLDWMDSIIMASTYPGQETYAYEFRPLKQLTELEQAEVDSKNASRDQIYLTENIVEPLDVMAQLAENGTYVSIDENRIQQEKESLEGFNFEE